MHLVTTEGSRKPSDDEVNPENSSVFIGTSLLVLFSSTDEIERIRKAGSGCVTLSPPYHMGEEDTYLLLPDDIGEEIIDILSDGDIDLMHEAMRDGLLVRGEVAKNPHGAGMLLDAAFTASPLQTLGRTRNHAARIAIEPSHDPVRTLNKLPHVQCTTLSTLVDDDGLEAMLREEEYVGLTWRPPSHIKALEDIEPTYCWSRRLSESETSIELALFQEDEEMVVVLRPALLAM